MFSKIAFVVVLLGFAAAQSPSPSVFVKVTGFAESENVVVTQQAVSEAVAKIDSACKAGDNVNVVAQAQAKKVVEAVASAVVGGGIYIKITGDGSGQAALAAEAESKATAIAEAIAKAIAEISDGPNVAVSTITKKEVTESVKAAIIQQAGISGEGQVLAVAAATATAFVSAVAEALSKAAASCNGEIGTVAAEVDAQSSEVASFAAFTSTFAQSAVDLQGPGFAFVSKNDATASSSGGSSLAPLSGTPNGVVQTGPVIARIVCSLGLGSC